MRISAFKDDCVVNNKYAYPIQIHKVGKGYLVDIPDFDISTEGYDVPDALYMARDAIKLMCEDMIADGKEIPLPFSCMDFNMSGIFSFVDIDLSDLIKNKK